MAFGTTAVVNDPLITLTEGQPEGAKQEKRHNELVSQIEEALSNEAEVTVSDRCHGDIRLVNENDSIRVHRGTSTSALDLYQLGLPLLSRICEALGA